MATVGESDFKLRYKSHDIIQQIKTISGLSLATLQRLYLKHFKEDASRCDDARLLARKLQYWLQFKYKKHNGQELTKALRSKTREVLALPITPEQEEQPMAKVKRSKKSTKKAKAEPVDEVEEDEDDDLDDDLDEDGDDAETEDDDDDDDEDESDAEEGDEVDEDDDDDDDDDEGDEGEEEETPKPKREAPARTGTSTIIKLRNQKLKANFVYEAMVKIFHANRKLKATDEEIQASVQKAFPNVNFKKYRVEADRKKYNKGMFKGQDGAPGKQSIPYTPEGKKLVRGIPPPLRDHVKRGQPVSQTIAENRKKGLIPAKGKGKKAKKVKK